MVAQSLLLHDVLSLPVADRMELFERLRDNLQDDSTAPPFSEQQERELDRRNASFVTNPDEGSSLDEVEAKLAARRK